MKMRAIIIGSVKFSKAIFMVLNSISELKIVAVITKRDSKINSDFYSLESDAVERNIPVLISNGMDKNNIKQFIKKSNIDIGFCIGWSHILSEDILNMAVKGFIGYHPAHLPYNRGRHPLIWALSLGLSKTSSTFFLIIDNILTIKLLINI